MIFTYGDGTFTTTIEAEELTDTTDPEVYLDRKINFPECNSTPQVSDNITATYDVTNNKTKFVLPYSVQGKTIAVVRPDETKNKGLVLGELTSGTDLTCTVRGDWTKTKIAFGRVFKFEYEFNKAHKPSRDQARQRLIGELSGRLQVATWTVSHYRTGAYRIRIKRKNRAHDSVHQFDSTILNVQNNKLTTAEEMLDTGTMRVPVYSKNLDCRVIVESETWMPVTLVSCWWEGNFNDRARSVS